MTDFDKDVFVGKTIKSASYIYKDGCDDKLQIEFTDGSAVKITAMHCNDDTGALLFEAVP